MGARRRAHGMAVAATSCLELASLGKEGPGSVSTASVCSAFSYLDGDAEDTQVDDFEHRLDALFEKRGSTREKALEALAVMLRVDYRGNDCISHNETITSRCLAALKRGSAVESSLASQLLGLHILTLGQPDDRLFQVVRPELERSASVAAAGGTAVQVAATDTLALAAFVLAEDEEGTRTVMCRLKLMWHKGDVKVRAAAVRGWSFLLTSLYGVMRDGEATACLAALAGLMGERDLELRTAAGEAAAVLRCCCSAGVLGILAEEGEEEVEGGEEGCQGDEEQGEKAEEEEASAVPAAAAAGSGCGQCPRNRRRKARRAEAAGGGGGLDGGLADVRERMQDLASNKGELLRRNRRDRATQRATFRALLGALNDARVPECRIKLRYGDCLTVEGVAANHRLAFLRRFLAGGFQAHLQHNPLLHDVFDFRPRTERPERMSTVEKRLTRSCHSADSRARTADRQWARDAKASRLHFGEC